MVRKTALLLCLFVLVSFCTFAGTYVSLAPNVTEIICSLGSEDSLIGRTDYCNYPESVLAISSIGDMYNPNLELIYKLKPDAVIASSIVSPEIVERLNSYGIKTYQFFHEYDGLEGTLTLINEIGSVIGKEKEAEVLIEELRGKMEYVKNKTSGIQNKKKCILMISWGDWGDYAATGGTFIDDMINIAGGINIAADCQYWSISRELLLAENPEVVFLTNQSSSVSINVDKAFMKTKPYNKLKASENKKVYVLDNDATTRQSIRSFDILLQIEELLYPDNEK